MTLSMALRRGGSVGRMTEPIPSDCRGVTPYLIVDGADAAIRFYTDVLGATERMRMDAPNGRIGHAELELCGAPIMLADEFPEMSLHGPRAIGGTSVMLHIYVDDVDDVFAKALAAGATSVRKVETRFYGDRSCQFEDPFGHRWDVATHVEDVSDEEIARRAEAEGYTA
jgi:PhnB protein